VIDADEERVMTHDTHTDDQLRNPDEVRAPDGTRGDGRPTGDEPPAHEAPTEAPEERGETPATEHAPGADL
jgi:hypothetical protein